MGICLDIDLVSLAPMIFITQIIHAHPDKEKEYQEFEDFAAQLMLAYGGKIIHRIQPAKECFINHLSDTLPFEVNILSFPSEAKFMDYFNDTKRQEYIHLKNETIQPSFMLKGNKLELADKS